MVVAVVVKFGVPADGAMQHVGVDTHVGSATRRHSPSDSSDDRNRHGSNDTSFGNGKKTCNEK